MSGRQVEHARAIGNESKRKQWLEFLELEKTLKIFYLNPFALSLKKLRLRECGYFKKLLWWLEFRLPDSYNCALIWGQLDLK